MPLLGCTGHPFWLLLWLSADAKAPIVYRRPSPPNDVPTQSSWDPCDGCAMRWGTQIMVSEFRAPHAGLTWHKPRRLNSLSPWPGEGSEKSPHLFFLGSAASRQYCDRVLKKKNISTDNPTIKHNQSTTLGQSRGFFIQITVHSWRKYSFFRFSTVSPSGWKSTDEYYILFWAELSLSIP